MEFRPFLENESIQKWLSWILVNKRVALDNINQNQILSCYSVLLAKLNKKSLYSIVLKETYNCISKFLSTSQGVSEKALSQNRNILKNLGFWLGCLTLAREKPIVLKYLNLKALLLDAFQNNRLFTVLPLVCRILEVSKGTIVFKPNNPWLSVILGLLAEINSKDIKASLRCEIQVLFQKLDLEALAIAPTSLLSLNRLNQKLINMIQQKNNQPKSSNLTISAQNYLPSALNKSQFDIPVINQPQQISSNSANTNSSISMNQINQLKIAQLPDYITIDEKNLSEFIKEGIDLKMIVAQSVETAIKEIIPPVVSRSVTIALITTRQLALKDFSLEKDERKILRGTHLIVQNLSGSLALVTCREPLRLALCENLKENLTQQTNLNEENIEKIVKITSLDNLDLGCALIKKAVIEKALEDVNNDQTILEILKKRKIAREKGENYFDEKYMRLTQFLPEALRPSINGLTEEQLKIYEDFGSVQRKNPHSPGISRNSNQNREEESKEFNFLFFFIIK